MNEAWRMAGHGGFTVTTAIAQGIYLGYIFFTGKIINQKTYFAWNWVQKLDFEHKSK